MMYPSVTHPHPATPPHMSPSQPYSNPYAPNPALSQPYASQGYPSGPPPGPRPAPPAGPEDPWNRIRAQDETIQKKDAEIAHLTELLAEVEQHLRTKTAEQKDGANAEQISELASQLIAVTNQKETVESRLAEAERTIENIRRQENDMVGPLEAKIASLMEEKMHYEAQIAALTKDSAAPSTAVSTTTAELEHLRQQNRNLERDHVNAQEKLQVVESRLMTSRREAAEAVKRNEYLESQLRERGVGNNHFEAVKLVSEYQIKAEFLEEQVGC